MRYIKLYEQFTNNVTIGIDIDGTISNFADAFNATYKKYFPDKETQIADDWYWYRRMDYEGEKPEKWLKDKKAETFELAKSYPDAVITINNIYDFVKSLGYTLNIVTNQVTQEARDSAIKWLKDNGFKYDDIVFVDAGKDKWKHVDIMVDDADKVIGNKPLDKVSIKIEQLWNKSTEGDFNIPNIKALTINVIKQAIDKLKNNMVK
jgi:hypothetical protein